MAVIVSHVPHSQDRGHGNGSLLPLDLTAVPRCVGNRLLNSLLKSESSRETGYFTSAVSSQWLQRLPRRAYLQTVLTGPYCRLVKIHAPGHELARATNVLSVPTRPILLREYMYLAHKKRHLPMTLHWAWA